MIKVGIVGGTGYTGVELLRLLARHPQVELTAITSLIAALEDTIRASISRKGPRTFVLPGILKITAVAVPAKKARKGINLFTGEETVFKAKPATVKVKVRPMKRLKDAASS